MNAMAIDIMLPALGEISDEYQLVNANDRQLVIFVYVLGFGAPQLIFGPISDRYGRKMPLQICLLGYALAGFVCIASNSFAVLLAARFVQGVFASGVRVVATSIVRDLFVGREMASVMSLIMTVFMIIPIIAPALGAGIMLFVSWPWLFIVLGLFGAAAFVWVGLRLPETMPGENKKPISLPQTVSAYRTVISTPVTLGYMTASGVIFGALYAFVAASEQIFTEVFHKEDTFVLWFGGIAAALAAANLTNSKIVRRFGMRRISHIVLIAFTSLSLLCAAGLSVFGETLWIFFPVFMIIFGCFGMLGSNFSAIALEPLGNIAGTASAALGFATTTVASFFGWLVASQFNGSVIPILLGYAGLGFAALVIVLITERGKLFGTK